MRRINVNVTEESGIYKIICIANNKFYIGSTINIRSRFLRHMAALRKNKHVNNHMQLAFNKYGEENFTVIVLELCPKELLHKQEDFWINQTNCLDKSIGFNKRDKASGGTTISGEEHYLYGKHMSDETKAKLSASTAGENHPMFGKKVSQEAKDKRRATMIKKGWKPKIINPNARSEAKLGSNNPHSKLNEEKVREIKLKLKNGIKPSILADEYCISRANVSDIKHNRTWSHVNV